MKISNRVKRNLTFTLLMLGVSIIIARGWTVALNPSSGKAWFNLCSITLLTYLCFDRFRTLQKRVNRGILFGA